MDVERECNGGPFEETDHLCSLGGAAATGAAAPISITSTQTRMHAPLCCERIEIGLEEYLEGDLPRPLALRFESHLRVCVDCWRDLDRIRTIVTCLGDLPRHPMPLAMKEVLLSA